jgi:DNA-directed RNA polymerase subunit RPC12/RpoP
MALIKCSECEKEISDKASACPSCGNPIHIQSVMVNENKTVVEIEQTDKKWKKKRLWSLGFFLIGVITMTKSIGLGIFFIFIAICIGVVANIGAWWTNG